jgi:hypothetical protein
MYTVHKATMCFCARLKNNLLDNSYVKKMI